VKTTTVRFDTETWKDIERQSDALEIAHAEFIRGAVHRRLGRLADADRITAIEHDLTQLKSHLDRVTNVVRHIATTISHSKS
jgi:hypothetical protein